MRRLALLVVLLAGGVASGQADTITLTNGRVIEADRAWYDGPQLLYQKNGGTFGLPRNLIKSVEQRPAPEPPPDPDVVRARQRLAAGDPSDATRLLRLALARDANSVPVLLELAETYLALGDLARARDHAVRAVEVDGRNPRSRTLLGEILATMGDREGAAEEYRRSLQLRPDAVVRRKLDGLVRPPNESGQATLFRLRYDGGVNEQLGVAVLKTLTAAYTEFAQRLGFSPEEPVTVELQTEAPIQDGRTPVWAAGINDGSIRVPVRGIERPTARLIEVFRHELAHSFVTSRTGGNCPTWLQEGIAQWLEGSDPGREDPNVAAAVRQGRLIPLVGLEGPFQNLNESQITLAYSESLSVVAYVVRSSGESGVVRLISALADRLPAEEAIPVSLALSYPELQRAWEKDVTARIPGTNRR